MAGSMTLQQPHPTECSSTNLPHRCAARRWLSARMTSRRGGIFDVVSSLSPVGVVFLSRTLTWIYFAVARPEGPAPMIQMLCTLRLVCAATEPIAEQSVSVDRGRWSGAEVRDDTDDDGVELGVGDVLALRPQHSSSHVARIPLPFPTSRVETSCSSGCQLDFTDSVRSLHAMDI